MVLPRFDQFEADQLRHGLRWFNGLYLVFYLVALGSLQLFEGTLSALYQHPDALRAAWMAGLIVVGATTMLSKWTEGQPGANRLLGLGAVVLHFVMTVGGLVLSGTSGLLAMGALLISASFTLALAGLFSRSVRAVAGLTAAIAGAAAAVFGFAPDSWFPLAAGDPLLVMAVVLAFGVPVAGGTVMATLLAARRAEDRARDLTGRLARLAFEDPVTGLPNGRQLEDDLGRLSEADFGAGDHLALVGVRIEGLAELNQLKGLEQTDLLVAGLTAELRLRLGHLLQEYPGAAAPAPLRPLYRLEPATLAVPVRAPQGLTGGGSPPLDRLVEAVFAEHNRHLPLSRPLRFHGGFTLWPDDDPKFDRLTTNLLNLLYVAGPDQRGRFLRFDGDSYRSHQRREEVKEALAHEANTDAFRAVFQPRVRVDGTGVAGYEALARWTSPVLGPVSPGEFIPLAERLGVLEPITRTMLRHAADLIRALANRGLAEFRVSVNLSPGLLSPTFLDELVLFCSDPLMAAHLEWEITEGLMMVIDGPAAEALDRLRALGTTFAIDDFGTGYSNLGYLQTFHAEVLKIDKRFIDALDGSAEAEALVATIAGLGHAFGMRIVAEGVETPGQRDIVVRCGCDEIQGYLYSKPLPRDEALALVSFRSGDR